MRDANSAPRMSASAITRDAKVIPFNCHSEVHMSSFKLFHSVLNNAAA